jgi:hypothetical protein
MLNCKLGREVRKTELIGRSPLRRRRAMLDCSAIEEEEKDNKSQIFITVRCA